jgi:hypothetical protein
MRRLIALLIGLSLAVVLGYLYLTFSGPLAAPVAVAPAKPASASGGSNVELYLIVLFSWMTAFVTLPRWLAAVLDFGFLWVGMAVFFVAGFFVYMVYPNNTLHHTSYVAFLCSIAIVVPRLMRILRLISRGDIH